MIRIPYEEIRDQEEATDRVVTAAFDVVRMWEKRAVRSGASFDLDMMQSQTRELVMAVRALRSLDADRGVRNPSTPGQQATGQEPAHGEDSHDREQS